ncbi:MAG TPA: hypothetical protein VNN77_15650 [candidate division Zixibacteria bacterium]|nr:hypothetical protein [candidate division Zixibacteria bacterium]
MNARERSIYRLETRIIRRYFKGLRPRPVRLVKTLPLGAQGEAAEPELLIKDTRRTREELEKLLKHELIHYELKEKGNVYHGHGQAFLKRARQLGIVDTYVLLRCFSAEEYQHRPTVRTTRKIPLPRFMRLVDRWFETLFQQVLRLPDEQKIKIYPCFQSVYAGWAAFSEAVRTKKRYVVHEIWKVKKGRRGKDLHALQQEYASLRDRAEALLENIRKGRIADGRSRRMLEATRAAMEKIRKTLEKDYGISPQ